VTRSGSGGAYFFFFPFSRSAGHLGSTTDAPVLARCWVSQGHAHCVWRPLVLLLHHRAPRAAAQSTTAPLCREISLQPRNGAAVVSGEQERRSPTERGRQHWPRPRELVSEALVLLARNRNATVSSTPSSARATVRPIKATDVRFDGCYYCTWQAGDASPSVGSPVRRQVSDPLLPTRRVPCAPGVY
jgi:hypothetical protein